jgi:NADP-dependent 3-hydroxy acid dehydrogenase YdfG
LRAAGSNVLLAGRNEERLASLGSELDCVYRVVDATSLEQVDECFAEASKELGHIDGILNCVGSVLLKPAHTTSADEWQQRSRRNRSQLFKPAT